MGNFRTGGKKVPRSPAQNQSRQGGQIPVSPHRHHNGIGNSRCQTALPFFVKGNHPDKIGHAQHRRHGNLGHLGQIQPQPCQGCPGEGAGNRHHACGYVAKPQIGRKSDLGQSQGHQAYGQPVGNGIPTSDCLGKQSRSKESQGHPEKKNHHRHALFQHQLERQPRYRRKNRRQSGYHQRLIPAFLPFSQQQRQQRSCRRPDNPLISSLSPEKRVARQSSQTDHQCPPSCCRRNQPQGQGLGKISQTGRAEQETTAAVSQHRSGAADPGVEHHPLQPPLPPAQVRFHHHWYTTAFPLR